MSLPVKLSDELILDARLVARLQDRSIAGQIEFWANLGRAIEPLLRGDQVLALRKMGAVQPLSSALESVEAPEGRRRLSQHLGSLPFPHYEPHPTRRGLLVRTDADGQTTVGRFVRRKFQAVR